MSQDGSEVLRFADFEIQPQAARLLRGGRPVGLEPRAFDLLVLLARSGGRLVTKEEILQAVWHGAFVTDNALTRSVARLRKALGDSATEPRFIETVHSRGYRFLARVETSEDALATPAPPVHPPRRHRGWIAAAAAVGLFALALPTLWSGFRSPVTQPAASPAPDPRRVAVLPLENLSGAREDDYFVDGLTEQIISNLAQIDGLRVLARTTTGAYEEGVSRVAEIARELRAGTVLEGSARRSGSTLRIHVQLIDGISEEHLWSAEFDRSMADVFAIQSEVAMRVAEELKLSISKERLARMRGGPTTSASAYDLYLRGRAAYRKQAQVGNEEAMVFYRRALEADPDFALAEAGLANVYAARAIRYGFGPENEERAVASAERALALNPELPEAYKALGVVAFRQDRLLDAVEWNRKALALNPSYDEAIYNLSSVLHASGRWDEALSIQLRETEMQGSLAAAAAQLLLLGFPEEGAALATRALASEPFPVYLVVEMARRDARGNDLDSARRRLAELRAARPDWAGSWEVSGEIELLAEDYAAAAAYFEEAHRVWGSDAAEPLINLARIYWLLGDHAAAEELCREVESLVRSYVEQGSQYYFHYWMMAAIESMRGNSETAADWYERAVDWGHRATWPDETDPTFAAIRQHPRFRAQLQRMRSLLEEMRAAVEPELGPALDALLAG